MIWVIAYKAHVAIEILVGGLFLIAPFALGFSKLDAWYYLVNAIVVVSFSEPSQLVKADAAPA